MAGENVEVSKKFLAAFNDEGFDEAKKYLHPEIVWHSATGWTGPSRYVGHDEARELVLEWTENFDSYSWIALEYIEVGDRILTRAEHSGYTKDGGVRVSQLVATLNEFRDGVMTESWFFWSWDEARAAAGLDAQDDD